MRIRSLYRNCFYILFALMLVFPAVNLAQPARVEAATQAEIDAALASGCAWLVLQQSAVNGSWPGSYPSAYTGIAVAALEHYAEQLGTTPLSPSYIYHTNVQRGLDYLFSVATRDNVGHDWVWWTGSVNYETGICLMAVARSGAPTATVVGGTLAGMTYKQVAQAVVDYFYSAQISDGGWYYTKGGTYSDQSVTGWVSMGLGYAAHSMGCIIPAGLLTNLSKWNEYIQWHTPGTEFGGAGYTSPGTGNIYRTGHLLFALSLCGGTLTATRVQEALTYMNTHWGDANTSPGWRGSSTGHASYIATIAATKGFTELGITTFSGHDWYQDFADVIVPQQYSDGHWQDPGAYDIILGTSWALLTLLKAHSAPCLSPTVTVVDPARGFWGQGLSVVIKGNNFNGTKAVSFGEGITVNSFTVDSASQITAIISVVMGAVGGKDVTVTNSCGSGRLPARFTAIPQLPNKTGGSGGGATQPATRAYIPPAFEVQNATVAASKAGPGEQIEVTATVTNKGGSNGTTKVVLYVNGQEADSKGIALSSGQSTPVSFKVSRNDPGTYQVYVNGTSAGTFTVDLFNSNDMLIYASVALFVIGMIGLLYYLMKRRPAA